MDLVGIILLLVFVALSQCEPSGRIKLLGAAGHAEAMTAPLTPNPRCFCMPPSPVNLGKVSEFLDSYSSLLYKRLVVYFFQNENTGTYTAYIPNREKQRAFPDLNCDRTDTFIDGYIGDMGNFLSMILNNQHSWQEVRLLPQTTTPTPYSPPEPWSEDSFDNDEIDTRLDMANYYLNTLKTFKDTKPIFGSLTGATLKEKLLQLKRLHPDVYSKFMTQIRKSYPKWLISGSVTRFKPSRFPFDVIVTPQMNGKRVIIHGQILPHVKVQDLEVFTPNYDSISELYPDLYGNGTVLVKQWFDIILKGLNKNLDFVGESFDEALLKEFLLNVKSRQKFSIDLDGNVKDSSGRKIQLSNFMLRPILIGESHLINRVTKRGLSLITPDIVFLEALLVSGRTTKSLGIVPVSHVLTGHNKGVITETTSVQVIETITQCENGVCKSKKVCKNGQGVEEPCTCDHDSCSDPHVVVPVPRPVLPDPFIFLDKSGNINSPTDTANSEEDLGIRIIGGNAATNSGTPVSVKGRSGQ